MTNIISLILAVIFCIVGLCISYTGIKLYNKNVKDKDKDTFYKKFLNVPTYLKYTFVFNILCVIIVFIFIINTILNYELL